MTDPHDAELVWRSRMMQGHQEGEVLAARAEAALELKPPRPDPDVIEANRQRYRSGYDIETGRIWPAA